MALQCDLPASSESELVQRPFPDPPEDLHEVSSPQALVLSGGCFWCTEAVYRKLDGVLNVTAGYAGDSAERANYAAVSGGGTNHAEAVRIEYDPRRLSLGQILKVFFSAAHNPTHVDRQGKDVGRHYRSAIFYANEGQRRVAQTYIAALDAAKIFDAPIATTLESLAGFFPAEAEYQNYAERNPSDPYVVEVSMPKVRKVQHQFSKRLKI